VKQGGHSLRWAADPEKINKKYKYRLKMGNDQNLGN
jgi:hypothetical protein